MKKILIFLFIFLCITKIYAQEVNENVNANKEITIEIKAPIFGLQESTWSSDWYDFYNQKIVSKKELSEIISNNPESAKFIKKSKVANIFTWSCITAGISASIASYFVEDPKTKKICQGFGDAFILSVLIPISINENSFNKAVNKYNQDVLGLEKLTKE